MKLSTTATCIAAAIWVFGSLAVFTGCEDEPEHAPETTVYREPVYTPVYTYQPGYYYDEGYYDTYRHWHPREYYYYNGHDWDHRDRIPEGYVARERHLEHREAREAHEEHEEHERHDRDDRF